MPMALRPLATTEYIASSGSITGTSNVRDAAATTITGGSMNAYVYDNTGTTAVTATLNGTLAPASGAILLAATSATVTAITINGGTTPSIAFGSTEGIVTVTDTAGATLNLPISGTGGLTVGGFGNLTLGASATVPSGVLTVNGNELLIPSATVLANATSVQLGGGAQASGGTVTGGAGFIRFTAAATMTQPVTLETGGYGGFDPATSGNAPPRAARSRSSQAPS